MTLSAGTSSRIVWHDGFAYGFNSFHDKGPQVESDVLALHYPHCEAWGITVEAVSALGLARALTRDARLKDTLKDLLFVAARYQDRDLSLERATGGRIWILNAETRCFQHHRVDHCELFPGSRPAEWLRHQGCHSLSPARTWNFL
ncbi:MAG: hypothetical protein QF659_09080 [Dehalococcoidia bacterium]|nr:hypothetical protein [Dehalococcoidia bacterium]